MTERPGFRRRGRMRNGATTIETDATPRASVPTRRSGSCSSPMSTLEPWTVSPGEPDIRGWEVRTVTGRQLGTVSDLLVDRAKGEVVLLDVDLPGTDRHTFVPIRIVQIDRGSASSSWTPRIFRRPSLVSSARRLATTRQGDHDTGRHRAISRWPIAPSPTSERRQATRADGGMGRSRRAHRPNEHGSLSRHSAGCVVSRR